MLLHVFVAHGPCLGPQVITHAMNRESFGSQIFIVANPRIGELWMDLGDIIMDYN